MEKEITLNEQQVEWLKENLEYQMGEEKNYLSNTSRVIAEQIISKLEQE